MVAKCLARLKRLVLNRELACSRQNHISVYIDDKVLFLLLVSNYLKRRQFSQSVKHSLYLSKVALDKLDASLFVVLGFSKDIYQLLRVHRLLLKRHVCFEREVLFDLVN